MVTGDVREIHHPLHLELFGNLREVVEVEEHQDFHQRFLGRGHARTGVPIRWALEWACPDWACPYWRPIFRTERRRATLSPVAKSYATVAM